MPARALIIAIEKYPLLKETLAGDLTGTRATALSFLEWLMAKKNLQAGDYRFCCFPPLPEATAGADRGDIRTAILELRNTGAGNTNEFYFFFSGHGYAQIGESKEPTANALLAADYVDHNNTGDKALSHDEIVRVLRNVLGPGTHFHFVDVCRFGKQESEFPLGTLGIPARPMDTGQATVHVLFSTSLGDAARVNSAFGDALLHGLHGTGRAKEWFTVTGPPRRLGVRFQSLSNYIREQVKGQTPDPNPSDSGPGLIYEFPPPVPEKHCTIVVANGGEQDKFQLQLCNSDQDQIAHQEFVGTQHTFPRPPNEYYVSVTKPGAWIEPAGLVYVDLFEDAKKEFSILAGGFLGSTEEAVPPEAAPEAKILLPRLAQGVLRAASTGESIAIPPGGGSFQLKADRYDLEVRDQAGFVVRRRSIEAKPGTKETIDLTQPAGAVQEELLRLVQGAHEGGAADFSESLGPLADQDPALWVALLGAAQIVRRPNDEGDFHKLRDIPLADFSVVLPNGSGLYVLSSLDQELGPLHIGLSTLDQPIPRWWERAANVQGTEHLRHRMILRDPGQALISAWLGTRSVMTLATAFLPNRATLVTITQDRQGNVQIHQMMLPLGHLTNFLPLDVQKHLFVEDNVFGQFIQSRTRSVKFIVQAQRAFRQRQVLSPEDQPSTLTLDQLLYGKWLDPVMAALATYELIRRGRRGVLDIVANNLEGYFGDFPDTPALVRLISGKRLPNTGCPLFLDGLSAFDEDELEIPFPAARLDNRGMWTLWRGQMENLQITRYYNPPREVRQLGRILVPGTFESLCQQLQGDEVIIGCFDNAAPAPVATYVGHEARLEEIQSVWGPIDYFAMNLDAANRGFDQILRLPGAKVDMVTASKM